MSVPADRRLRRIVRLRRVALLVVASLSSAAIVSAAAGGSVSGPAGAAGGQTLEPAERLDTTSPGPEDPPVGTPLVSDNFDGTGPLVGYTTARPDALPIVGRVGGRYRAELTDNADDKTLHFNRSQGRLDAKLVSFPFDYVVRNIGIGSLANSQSAPNPAGSTFMFAGVQVHSTDLDAADSAHVVVGHRGNTKFTIEGKKTVAGRSRVNDIGANTAPTGRADIRIVGNADRTLTVYWQTPGSGVDNWQLYRGTGNLPGPTAPFGQSVYVGLITYAFGSTDPFVGTADGVELAGESPARLRTVIERRSAAGPKERWSPTTTSRGAY